VFISGGTCVGSVKDGSTRYGLIQFKANANGHYPVWVHFHSTAFVCNGDAFVIDKGDYLEFAGGIFPPLLDSGNGYEVVAASSAMNSTFWWDMRGSELNFDLAANQTWTPAIALRTTTGSAASPTSGSGRTEWIEGWSLTDVVLTAPHAAVPRHGSTTFPDNLYVARRNGSVTALSIIANADVTGGTIDVGVYESDDYGGTWTIVVDDAAAPCGISLRASTGPREHSFILEKDRFPIVAGNWYTARYTAGPFEAVALAPSGSLEIGFAFEVET
jgi:hypothetical protein